MKKIIPICLFISIVFAQASYAQQSYFYPLDKDGSVCRWSKETLFIPSGLPVIAAASVDDPYYDSFGSWSQDYDDMWGWKRIGMEDAWNISRGENVIIAVLVNLWNTDRTTLIDNVDVPAIPRDYSYGRYPEGTGGFVVMENATPGAANIGTDPGYELRISEITPSIVDNSYDSTGAAATKMLLDYMIDGAIQDGASLTKTTQNGIYESIRGSFIGTDLMPDEITRFLNTNDPYDDNIFNPTRYNNFTGPDGGNPYKGYNFDTDSFQADPDIGIYAGSAKTSIDTICHRVGTQITKDVWWDHGELVAHALTPSLVPLGGSYDRWVMVTGFTANKNPVTSNLWDPWSITEDFQAWSIDFYDPSQGQDMITLPVDDFAGLYLPISIEGNSYFGQYVQIDEPPDYDQANRAYSGSIGSDSGTLALDGETLARLAVEDAKRELSNVEGITFTQEMVGNPEINPIAQ